MNADKEMRLKASSRRGKGFRGLGEEKEVLGVGGGMYDCMVEEWSCVCRLGERLRNLRRVWGRLAYCKVQA